MSFCSARSLQHVHCVNLFHMVKGYSMFGLCLSLIIHCTVGGWWDLIAVLVFGGASAATLVIRCVIAGRCCTRGSAAEHSWWLFKRSCCYSFHYTILVLTILKLACFSFVRTLCFPLICFVVSCAWVQQAFLLFCHCPNRQHGAIYAGTAVLLHLSFLLYMTLYYTSIHSHEIPSFAVVVRLKTFRFCTFSLFPPSFLLERTSRIDSSIYLSQRPHSLTHTHSLFSFHSLVFSVSYLPNNHRIRTRVLTGLWTMTTLQRARSRLASLLCKSVTSWIVRCWSD